MIKKSLSYIFFLLVIGCLQTGCSKSDDQRDFENEALKNPQNVTQTSANGEVQQTDEDDWRIAPMYRGLISIGTPDNQPPYPNPLSFNQDLTINIYIRSIETLNEIVIRKFEFVSQGNFPIIATREELSSPSLETFTLSGQIISGSSGGSETAGTYRMLIYDGQQNLITYGDIRIE